MRLGRWALLFLGLWLSACGQTYTQQQNLPPPETVAAVDLEREGDPLVIGFLGSLIPTKGLHVLVHAVQRLRGQQRFSGLEELSAQIGRDADQARSLLSVQTGVG